MIDKIDFSAEIQSLADLIIPDLPDDWEKTYIVFEDYGKGAWGIDSYCLVKGEKFPADFSVDDGDSIAELFGAIRKKCRAEWKIARLKFNNNYKWEISFEYDDD